MSNPLPSTFLLNLISTIWSEPSGRIFLMSVIYYLFSAFAMSGYMSFFAGGFGNIGFGDFSLVDFLFFFPTLIVTGLNFILDNIWRAIKFILLQFALPNFAGLIIAALVINNTNATKLFSTNAITTFLYASIILWAIGINFLFSSLRARYISFLLQLFGAFLFFTFATAAANTSTISPIISVNPSILLIINLTSTIMGIIAALLLPLAIGITIARETINSNFLSKIQAIELTQPVFGFKQWHVHPSNDMPASIWSFITAKPAIQKVFLYQPPDDIFLVASLNKVTAIYAHKPDGETSTRGKLFLISNSIISSLELKSGKNVLPNDKELKH